MFCGVGYSDQIAKQFGNWKCFQCTGERVHLLQSRADWQERLKEMFQETQGYEDFEPTVYYDTIPFEQRRPIRVLALFDGIATGLHVLNELDFVMDIYVASEVGVIANHDIIRPFCVHWKPMKSCSSLSRRTTLSTVLHFLGAVPQNSK